MALDMRVIGKKINNMEKVLNPGLMVQTTKETTLKVKSMVLECSHGQIKAPMKDNSLKIILKAKVSTSGQTGERTKVIGKTTKWTGTEYSPGQTAEGTKGRTWMIKRTGKAPSRGLTVGNT